MSRTLISWSTLFQNDVFGAFGKLASVWFTDLVFQIPDTKILSNALDKLVSDGTISNNIADELTKKLHTEYFTHLTSLVVRSTPTR